jgi:hypothetical protein
MTTPVQSIRLLALVLACLSFGGLSGAAALDYPTKPVRWIVGYACRGDRHPCAPDGAVAVGGWASNS